MFDFLVLPTSKGRSSPHGLESLDRLPWKFQRKHQDGKTRFGQPTSANHTNWKHSKHSHPATRAPTQGTMSGEERVGKHA